MDDSWDSASSPDVKKKSYGKSKLSSLGGIPPVSPRRSKGGAGLDESREFDPDLLFSPTNSQGSPAGTPIDYKKNLYNFDDSPKKSNTDYLSNFVLESNELEDSILGGLLGGGAKKSNNTASRPVVTRQRSPQAKLEPIDTSDNTSGSIRSRSPRKSSSPPKSNRQSSFRSSPSDMNTSTFNEFDDDDDFPIAPAFGVKRASSDASEPQVSFNIPASTFDPAMMPSRGKGRQAQPSFDASQDLSFLNEIQNDEVKLAPAPGVKRFTDGLVHPGTSSSVASTEPYFPSALQTTPRSMEKKDMGGSGQGNTGSSGGSGTATAGVAAAGAVSGEEDKEDDSAGLAFIPSFMEPGRQNRRRRQLDTSPSKGFGEGGSEGTGSGAGDRPRSSGAPKLNDLDIALGLSGAPSVTKKAVIDPFSAVDKKIPTLEKQANAAFMADSDDSSSDDALFNRNRYNRKDTFSFSKPVPPTNSTSAGGGAKTTGKEASQGFSSTTAFPPPSATASTAPMTAPSRVSSFTPAKPGSLPESSSLSPRQPESSGAASTTVPNYSNRINSVTSASQPGPAHGMKMSDSFEETAGGAGASRSPTSPTGPHSNASLASLPQISPVSSFRFNSGTGSGTAAASTTTTSTAVPAKNKLQAEKHSRRDFSDDDDELDVSGIVRIDLEEDLLIPRSNRSGGLKSPSGSSVRPKTATSRSSFENAAPVAATVGDAAVGSTHIRSGSSGGPIGRLQTAAAVEEAAIRTNSPAGVLTEAVQAFDKEKETSVSSRRNSASSHLSATSGSFTGGYGSSDSMRERRPSFNTGGNMSTMAAMEVPYSSFSMRKGTREDLPSMTEEPEHEEVRAFSGSAPSTTLPTGIATGGQSSSGSERLVQQLQIDKQALEGRLLREIEELKVKLAHPQPASFKHAELEVSAEEREHYRVLQDSNIKYLQEAIDQKRLIAALESEISRLKDEALIKARHVQDEIVWMKEKYEGEIKDVKIKNAIETEALERRQEDALASLKKLHAHEIDSIKERYKSEDKFELIAGQLRTTSGSIQFIEQQLQSRQKGVEAMREGQIDARERLLADMEAKARERAEIAEAEGYRLKGILTHMEHVVSSLRDQGSEEKERLRQEHSRLQSRQTAFEAERQALQTRNLEELAYIKQRSKEVEIELAKLTQEKQMAYEALSSAQHKLDSERAEFNTFVSTNKRAFESTENRLKEEEQRIHRLRNEMLLERASLDERRADAMKEIEAAEELKNILQRAKQENETEKAELRRISQSYKSASEEILEQQNEIQQQKESLEERELTLREGFAQMKLAASELSHREQGIRESLQMLERKRQALERADRECMEQRVVSAAHFREWSMRQSSTELVALPPPPGSVGQRYETWPRHSRDQQVAQQDAEDNYNANTQSAEQIFAKYAGDVRVSADAAAHYSNNSYNEYGPGRMARSADFDTGFNQRGAGVAGTAGGFRPRESMFEPSHAYRTAGSMSGGKPTAHTSSSSVEKENLYSQILTQQQADRPWLEVFQEKLQRNFQHGDGSKDTATDRTGRLPSELRTAQQALRQSRDQLARSSTTALSTQRLLQDESEFLLALQSRRSGTTAV